MGGKPSWHNWTANRLLAIEMQPSKRIHVIIFRWLYSICKYCPCISKFLFHFLWIVDVHATISVKRPLLASLKCSKTHTQSGTLVWWKERWHTCSSTRVFQLKVILPSTMLMSAAGHQQKDIDRSTNMRAVFESNKTARSTGSSYIRPNAREGRRSREKRGAQAESPRRNSDWEQK